MRLALLVAGYAAGSAFAANAPGLAAPCDARTRWPLWSRYQERFLSSDGRVVDWDAGGRTTSEAQGYAMFFALVAGDRPLFERLMAWTRDNLAQGDLRRHLPAWHWGRDFQGRWVVLDANPASDADLWIAYALLEAGRLWSKPGYTDLAHQMLANVTHNEVADLPSFGPALLPAPFGFELPAGEWRLNPSYVPPQILRRFVTAHVPGPWQALLGGAIRMIRETAHGGLVADWVLYSAEHGFGTDPVCGPVGSYDAIRVYLWASMLAADDPLRAPLASATNGLYRMARRLGEMPERIDLYSERTEGGAPPGFWAVALAEARRRGDAATASRLEQKLARARHGGLYGTPPRYYDQNLILFAQGFIAGRFRFARDGSLHPSWEAPCAEQ